MNEHLVLASDGVLYLAGYGVLGVLLAVSVRLFYRGHLRAGWMSAASCVLLTGLGKNVADTQAGLWLPGLDPYAQMAVGATATFLLGSVVVCWRYTCSLPSATAAALVLVLAMYGVSFALPWISDRALPPGPRMAQLIDSAYSRTREAREAAARFKTVNESVPGVMAVTLHVLADLSAPEEFEAMKRQFGDGVRLFAARKAEWDAMTPEERESNRRAIAEFMAEQGLESDRYSLAALKGASMEDVQNLVAFMRDLQSEQASGEATPAQIRPPAESLQIFLRNIRGATFSKEDHETMATFAALFADQGLDAAIARTRTELALSRVNPEWAGTFLAAMLETKSGLPVAMLVAEREALAALPAESPVAAPPVPRFIAFPTKFGYVRVPRGSGEVDELTAAADRIPVTGLLKGGRRVRVALGKSSLGLGDTYRVHHGSKVYVFRFEEVREGLVYVTAADRS